MTRRIGDIEMLRGVAVIFVLVFHAQRVLFPWRMPLWEHLTTHYVSFWPGVDLFFAISGFVIGRSLLPQLAAAGGSPPAFMRAALAFWVRRAWRLLPSAWLWLAVILLACVAFNRSGVFDSFHTNFESVIAALLSVANFRFASLFPFTPFGPSAPYWTLSLEEQFYLTLPVLAYLSGRRLAAVLGALLAIAFVLPEGGLLMVCRVHAVVLGVLLAMASRTETYRLFEPQGLQRSRFLGPVMCAALLTLLAALGPFDQHIISKRVDAIAILSTALVWLASYDCDYLWPPGAAKRVMLWVGSRSYALYLAHYPVFCATREIWFRASPPGTIWGAADIGRFLATALPLLLGCAELNYRFIELPLRARGVRIAALIARGQDVAGEPPRSDAAAIAPGGTSSRWPAGGIPAGLLTVISIVFGSWMVGSALAGMVRFYTPIPVVDEWPGAVQFYHRLADHQWGAWWAQHDDHRIVVQRALIWLDYRAFGGRNLVCLVATACMQAALAGALAFGWLRARATAQPGAWPTIFPLAVIAGPLASWSQAQIFTWGFETEFVAVYLFAALGCIALTRGAAGHRPERGLATAILCAALSMASMANGLFAAPVLVLQAVLMRRPLRDIAWLAAAAMAFGMLYLAGYHTLPQPAGLASTLPRQAMFFVALFGAPLWPAFASVKLGMLAGAACLMTLAACAVIAVTRGRRTTWRIILVSIAAFCLLSALSVAHGRYRMGLEQASASRYALPALLTWVVLFLLALDLANTIWGRAAILLVTLPVMAVLAVAQTAALGDNAARHDLKLGVLAHRVGLDRPALVPTVFPQDYQNFATEADWAAGARVGIYRSLPWLAAAGTTSEDPARRDDSRCDGVFDGVGRDAVGPTASGWVLPASGPAADLLILLTGSDGRVVGYGLSGTLRADVAAAKPGAPGNTGWTAFLAPGSNPAAAYAVFGRSFCKLRH